MHGTNGGPDLERLFPGGSEMACRMRAFDWSTSALGPPERWPQALRVALGICLTSHFPLHVWWGPSLTLFYNDAYIPFLGPGKHPMVLGCSGREAWSEIWDQIGPMIEDIFTTGAASRSEDIQMFFNRVLPQEEAYVTFSFSPVFGEGGAVEGMFCACTETTEKLIGARRLNTLRRLGVEAAMARSADEACQTAGDILAENPHDIPFAAIYTVDGAEASARLVAATGLAAGRWQPPAVVSLVEEEQPPGVPLTSVSRTRQPAELGALHSLGLELPGGPWADPSQRALVLPIRATAHEDPAGLLIAGVSARRPLDAAYRTFFDLVAGHIATAIADTRAHKAERRSNHDELEQRVRERTRALEEANQALRQEVERRKQAEERVRESEAQLAIELADMKQLQQISSQLIQEDQTNALYEQILNAAIAIMRSDMGSLQMLDLEGKELRLLAWKGFDPASAAFWAWVRADSESACGMALHTGERVIVPDVESCEFMAGTEDLVFSRLSGIRAVQSTPLISREGRLLGMISTHWCQPHQPSERELRLLDVLARQAADLLERRQAEEALHKSEERFRLATVAVKAVIYDWNILEDRITRSHELINLLGFVADDPATVTSDWWKSRLHPEDAERAIRFVQEQIHSNADSFEHEYRMVHRDGRIVWVSDSGVFLRAESGQALRCVGSVTDITKRKQAEAALQRTSEELEQRVKERTAELMQLSTTRQELLQRLVTVQEDERRCIARELHDTLGQFLSAINFRLSLLQDITTTPPEVAEDLHQLRQLVCQLDGELHHLTLELRPPALDDLGLPEAIRRHTEAWTRTTTIPVDVYDTGLESERLPQVIETTVYRIMQEALTNVLKHAKASAVSVLLERRHAQLRVIIEDNGIGFDEDVLTHRPGDGRRLGLVGMKERAALAGGWVEIETAPGAGTTLFVQIPLANEQTESNR